MADKKSCCNRGDAFDALAWAVVNKKCGAVLLLAAKFAPLAIVKAVTQLKEGRV
jgi:hypothetical protein